MDLKKQIGTPVIVANSLMRRRDDIDLAAFQQHWLDPHGGKAARAPGKTIGQIMSPTNSSSDARATAQ